VEHIKPDHNTIKQYRNLAKQMQFIVKLPFPLSKKIAEGSMIDMSPSQYSERFYQQFQEIIAAAILDQDEGNLRQLYDFAARVSPFSIFHEADYPLVLREAVTRGKSSSRNYKFG